MCHPLNGIDFLPKGRLGRVFALPISLNGNVNNRLIKAISMYIGGLL
jgi:hypothetical protein